MVARAVFPLLAGLLLTAHPTRAAEPEAGADPFAGTFDVTGLTTDTRSGDTRRIEGHLVITRKGEHYATAAELATQFPTPGGLLHTEVIGTGEGTRKGQGLEGTAHTQLVIQTVPGVDTDFAFIPREVGPKLVSTWSARLEADGTLVIDLQNRGEEGETYSPTKTTLRGKRVAMPNTDRP